MGERIRFLIVDDRAGLLSLDLDQELRESFEMLTATTREDALEMAAAHEPAVIIVDRDLPDADGYTLASQLNEEVASAQVLIAAPDDGDGEQRAARRAGAAGVLVKPYTAASLKRALFEAVNKHKRVHPRVDAQIEVDYASGDEVFLHKSLNLSVGGMFISTDEALEIDTRVQLRFRLPHVDREITAQGRVVWVQAYIEDGPAEQYPGMGISFESLNDTDRAVLKEFVVSRLQDLGIEPS